MDITIPDLTHNWLQKSGTTPAATARRAGVSASTLHRVLNGQVDPLVSTLREIALACGLELELVTHPSRDPLAAIAVRAMLEDGYQPPEHTATELAEWKQRLVRWAGEDNPLQLVEVAARMSAPARRRDAAFFSGTATLGRIASVGDAASGCWALSGAAGLYLPDLSDQIPLTTFLWCDEVRNVLHLLADTELRRTERSDRAVLVVVEGEPELFTGSFALGLVQYVAPIQIMIDCLSLGGQVADDARKEMSTW